MPPYFTSDYLKVIPFVMMKPLEITKYSIKAE